MMYSIFILLIAFQIKHFVCDFPLQNKYMLGKMNKENWARPLLAHSLVHSFGTFVVVVIATANIYISIMLSIVDLILHFIVDRLKASPKLGGRFKMDQPYFWWALGLDQMAHHIINYIFIVIIVSYNFI